MISKTKTLNKEEEGRARPQGKELKTLIGIDPEANYSRAIDLVCRLGFRNNSVTLLSVVEPMLMPLAFQEGSMLGPAYDVDLLKDVEEWRTAQAKKALRNAYERFENEGIKVDEQFVTGYPSTELLRAADEMKADLLVTASAHEGALRCALLNSISRAAVIGAKQSVLIAKKGLKEGKPLRAVLAVDHSDYCLKGVQKLIEMHPMGLRKVTVLTALEGGFSENRLPIPNLSSFSREAEAWREEKLKEKAYQICDELWKLRIKAEPLLIDAAPSEAIEEAMHITQSQLLILAAHGHGFLERAMLGSLSLHEAVAEHHSLLVLRP